MTATMQVQQPGVDEEHRQAYAAALAMYEQERGRPADHHWRALLYITSSDLEVWGILRPHLDMKHGRLSGALVDVDKRLEDELQSLTRSTHFMFALAIYFFGGPASTSEVNRLDPLPLPDMLRSLDERNIEIFMGALREFCSVS